MSQRQKKTNRDAVPAVGTGRASGGPGTHTETAGWASEDGAITTPNPTPRAAVRAALERAGWRPNVDEPHVIEASDGGRYGVAVAFENGQPVAIEYGDGEQDLQHCEVWDEAPGILAPADAGRLFRVEQGHQ